MEKSDELSAPRPENEIVLAPVEEQILHSNNSLARSNALSIGDEQTDIIYE